MVMKAKCNFLAYKGQTTFRKKRFINPLVLLSCAILLIPQSYLANAQTTQQIARIAFGSTVLLVMEDASGQPLSLGSGFFVRDGEIVSNLHVVKGASRGYAKVVGKTTRYRIEGISGIDSQRDLVLLRVSSLGIPPLILGDSSAAEVGDPVYAVGNPQGLEGTFSQGIISSIREVGSDKLLQITAPISPGSSGGPVLNSKGEVIGVSVATFKEGQNLNFAIPSLYLKSLLGRSGPPRSLEEIKPSSSQRTILGGLGDRSTAGVVGANFTYDSLIIAQGKYSFSIVNKLRQPIQNVYCLIVFYDIQGNPLDVAEIFYDGIIPGGLAKRVKSDVEASVESLNNPSPVNELLANPPRKPKGKIEFRILDFKIID